MVRLMRECASCRSRYISLANAPLCWSCKYSTTSHSTINSSPSDETTTANPSSEAAASSSPAQSATEVKAASSFHPFSSSPAKRLKLTPVVDLTASAFSPPKQQEVICLLSDDGIADGSEGEDEIEEEESDGEDDKNNFCGRQIINVDDDDGDDDEGTSRSTSRSVTAAQNVVTPLANNPPKIISTSSISMSGHLKFQPISSPQAQQPKPAPEKGDRKQQQDDYPETSYTNSNRLMKDNPYRKASHLALRPADQHQGQQRPETSNKFTTPQKNEPRRTDTTMKVPAFVPSPKRNVFNILLAGARRMTQGEKVVAASKNNNAGTQEQPQYGSFGRRRDYSKLNCPRYKKITGTDFVCDGFLYAKTAQTQNHFLTHFHSDHYGGITASWNMGIIYCSLPTAALVHQQLGVDKKYLHPLPMDTPTVIASRGKPITVTLLDANHCPGAVMFLFEVGKRKILHVGDFRWNREFMMQQAPLRSFFSNQWTLDELFLDTTYCDPKYKLPSQQETVEAIIAMFDEEIRRCKTENSKSLHLFGAYTIGKEKMYLSVAEHFNLKVYVEPSRFRVLSALNWSKERMSLLTTNKEEAWIWVVPLGHINMKKMPEYILEANRKPFNKPYDRVVGYRPTGWSLGTKPSAGLVSTRRSGSILIHSVPYSEHSSFPELLDCLECLKPQNIIPTVNASKQDEQVKMLLGALRQKQTTLSFGTR